MHLRQRRHFNRVVGDEGRLNECALAELSKQLIDEFSLAHGVVHLHAFRLAERANLLLALAVAVETCLFLNGFQDGQTAIRSLERHDVAVDFAFRLAVDGDTDGLQEFLCERHHPVVVLILHVEFHAGKLRVVVAVHALVAEVLADFVNTLETAYDQTFQIQLSGDSHIHILIQRVEMRDERTRRRAACNHLKRRRFHFGVAGLVEHFAHRANHRCTLQECFLHALVHHQIDIALAIAQFGVVEFVVGHAVLVFHDGQRLERLREQRQFLGVNRDFARLRAEHETFHANEVADVH